MINHRFGGKHIGSGQCVPRTSDNLCEKEKKPDIAKNTGQIFLFFLSLTHPPTLQSWKREFKEKKTPVSPALINTDKEGISLLLPINALKWSILRERDNYFIGRVASSRIDYRLARIKRVEGRLWRRFPPPTNALLECFWIDGTVPLENT